MSIMDKVMIKLGYIDDMSGDDFEEYATELLRKVGYQHVIHTPMINDHGLDAYGYTKNGTKIGFQFKRFQGKVSYNAIYETVGGGIYYHTKVNVLLTNSYFTDNTYITCHKMNKSDPNHTILLWNRNNLRNLIYKAYSGKNTNNIEEESSIKTHSRNKEINLFKKPAISKMISLFRKADYSTYTEPNNKALDLVIKNAFNKVGIKFIFCDTYDKQLYNKYVPENPFKKTASQIRYYSNIYISLLISGNLLFSKKEYDYITSMNHKTGSKILLKDYRHLTPINSNYELNFDYTYHHSSYELTSRNKASIKNIPTEQKSMNKTYLRHQKREHKIAKANILKKPAIKKIINLFHKNSYQTCNTHNISLNLIVINNFNKVGIKFIFCDSFDKQLYNKYVPLNILMRVALRISKHSNIHVNLIISSDLLFSKTEYNYIRQNINKHSNTKVILKDYKHLIPISFSYKMRFDGMDYYFLHNLIPKKKTSTKHTSFKENCHKHIPIIHNKTNKNYISRQFVGHNLHKRNVFYNIALLAHFAKNIKKLFQSRGFRVINLHQSTFDLLLINKNTNSNIGIKFIYALSQLYNIKYWEICNTIDNLYNDKFNSIKEYNIKSIIIITNGTFMPKEFIWIHNKYPKIYLKDFNLLKLEKKVNNNNSINRLLKNSNLSNKHLYKAITEKGYLNDIDYTHKSLLLMPLVYKVISKFAFTYGKAISIPEPTGYSLDFIIHYTSSFLVGVKFMLRMPDIHSRIGLNQLKKAVSRLTKKDFRSYNTFFFITNSEFERNCKRFYGHNKKINLLTKYNISRLF